MDGYFGPATDSKVRQWQTARGITSDGIIGNNSWIRLDEWGSVRAWSLLGTCGSILSGRQYLKNEAASPIYAWRICSSGMGLPIGDYCVQVESVIYAYKAANYVDPGYWTTSDCV